jgi:hypothetical protein
MLAYTIWLLICSWFVCTGWVLSLIHQLNDVGYLASLALAVALTCISIRRTPLSNYFLRLSWRRFRRPLPFIYLILVLMVLAGALLYPPTQYDGLCYRVPRMLHWIDAGRWQWLHTSDGRMNISATGMEWITMPLLVLTRSDRWLWIPDFISFLLMPGLVFGTFRRLGVSPRASWFWMWLLPAGFCFITQAGSIGNDLIALPYALGSVYFALRARDRNYLYLALAILSAALLTGIKASNIPLVLPAVVAALPSLYLLLNRAILSIGVFVIAASISFLPMAVINHLKEGHWSGDRDNNSRMQLQSPSEGVIGNAIMMAVASLQPPVMPYGGITEPMVKQLLGEDRFRNLQKAFPRFSAGMGEIAVEEWSGLGIGVTLSLLAAALLQFRLSKSASSLESFISTILISGWIALMVYMMKLGSESCSRLLTPYYPICLAGAWVFLVKRQEVVRDLAWRKIACASALMAIPVLILSPARPLWPAQTILGMIDHDQGFRLLKRAADVYSVYKNRNNALAPVAQALPNDVSVIGLAGGGGDLETSLWWPMGSRKVKHIIPGDDKKAVEENGVEVICSNRRILANNWNMSLEDFAKFFDGKIIASPKATETVNWGEEEWIVLDLRNR